MNNLCERVASIRKQICPRTSYATSGSMATQLNVLLLEGLDLSLKELEGEFKECLVQTKEFETLLKVSCKSGAAIMKDVPKDHVSLLLLPKNTPQLSEEILQFVESLARTRAVPLVFVLVEIEIDSEQKGKEGASARSTAEKESYLSPVVKDSLKNRGVGCSCNSYDKHRLMSFYANSQVSLLADSLEANKHKNPKGHNGQPAVHTRSQFKYLWDNYAKRIQNGRGPRDCGKTRVLQRLADRDTYLGRKLDRSEWEAIVTDVLTGGGDDFAVYSEIRERILGSSLEDDLIVRLEGEEEEEEEQNDLWKAKKIETPVVGGDEAEKGRAGFLVKMTLECVPQAILSKVGAVLDYGCAEGALTAELGRALGLPSSRVMGADIRSIPAEGFTFCQLQAEEPNIPPAVGQILPKQRDASVSLVTCAMVQHHVTHPLAAMQELRRIIRPGGCLVLREHHCDSAEMGTFLDITHGLYSLSWSEPVEWPRFLDEYQAWYRSQSDWDSLMSAAGWTRFVGEDRINRHYDAAQRSGARGDGRISNLIKAYYATYTPTPGAYNSSVSGMSTNANPSGAGGSATNQKRGIADISNSGEEYQYQQKETEKEKGSSIGGGGSGSTVSILENVSGNNGNALYGASLYGGGGSSGSVASDGDEGPAAKKANTGGLLNVVNMDSSTSISISVSEGKETIEPAKREGENTGEGEGERGEREQALPELEVRESRSNRGHYYFGDSANGGQAVWVTLMWERKGVEVEKEKHPLDLSDSNSDRVVVVVGTCGEKRTKRISKIYYVQ